MNYNLKVNGNELSCIIMGLDIVTKNTEHAQDDTGMFAKAAKDKAEALLAWIEADIAARQARGHYKNILQYGIDGLPFD